MKNLISKTTLIILTLLLAGCDKPEVNYNDIFSPPEAKIIQNELILKGGSSKMDSACYVVPHAKIDRNIIYVFGTLSLTNNVEKKIKLPNTDLPWKIYWVNKDESLIEIKKDL